jgi:hypothetical protein
MAAKKATPTKNWELEDGDTKCQHCGGDILRGYDGRQDRTWRHVYDYGTPHYLASGTTDCK